MADDRVYLVTGGQDDGSHFVAGQIDRALKAIEHTPALHRGRFCAVHVSVNRNIEPSVSRVGSRARQSQVCSVMAIGTPSLIGLSPSPIGCTKNILPFACFAKWITK